MKRLMGFAEAFEHRLQFERWPRGLRIAAAPGAILVLFAVAVALSLGSLLYAQHSSALIVQRDMRLVTTLDQVAAEFDHDDGDLNRLLVDKASERGQIAIAARSAAIERSLHRVREHLLAIKPLLPAQDQSRIGPITQQIETYAEAVDVVATMLEIDFSSSAAMLAPFRSNANRAIADIKAMASAGVSAARQHAMIEASRTRLLVMLVSGAMSLLTLLSVIWLLVASYRGAKLRSEMALRRSAEASALVLARHDTLTNLVNRRAFVEGIEETIEAHATDSLPFAVLLIDLDAFKAVNDLHGHAAGDAVLKAVSARLEASTPKDAIAARLGGDEFAVLLRAASSVDVIETVGTTIIRNLVEPITWQNLTLRVGASVGSATFPVDARTCSELLHSADLAMYVAKRHRKGTFRCFDSRMEKERFERLQLQEELRDGLPRGEMEPWYQPIVRLPGNELCGLEILARWRHPRLGWLAPKQFLQIAEEADQIDALTDHLLQQACIDLKLLPDTVRVALNVSPRQFTDPLLPGRLVNIIRKAGLCPSRFEIEITEDAVMDDLDLVSELIDSFHESGMKVALDDFGTGFAGLSTLARLPIDKIKIDRSFTHKLLSNPKNLKIVDAIIGLADGFQMHVTAEGIEDDAVALLVAAKGCLYGQGFLFGKPMPFGAVRRIFEDKQQGFTADLSAVER